VLSKKGQPREEEVRLKRKEKKALLFIFKESKGGWAFLDHFHLRESFLRANMRRILISGRKYY